MTRRLYPSIFDANPRRDEPPQVTVEVSMSWTEVTYVQQAPCCHHADAHQLPEHQRQALAREERRALEASRLRALESSVEEWAVSASVLSERERQARELAQLEYERRRPAPYSLSSGPVRKALPSGRRAIGR